MAHEPASSVESGDPRIDLVRTVRALSHLGLIDLRGAASIRLTDGRVLSTPRPGGGAPVPAKLGLADLVEVHARTTTDAWNGAEARIGPDDRDGPDDRSSPDARMGGSRWKPPLTIRVDIGLYRRRPDVHAIVHGQPMTALAFAAAGRALEPLTHTESALVYPSLPVHGNGELPRTPAAARAVADALGARPLALLPGTGSLAVGRTIAEAGMLTHQVELLARVNEAAAIPPDPGRARRRVRPEDSARVSAQQAPPADFQDFFDQVAEQRAGPPGPDPADESEAGLRARIVAACQLLYHHGLVQSLEHVSLRLPARDAFLMTPRRHLGRLQPEEIAVVGMDGRWRSGPLPPPPFLWFHRDIFAARPEVRAIVHTHQLLVRGLVMAGVVVRPLYRGGAEWAATLAATHETPDLMFDPDQRAAALAILGRARVLHEVSHGSDYLARTVEEATVGALQLERQARLWHLAAQLGRPRPLGPEVLAALPREEPGSLDWWRYFRSELPPAGAAAG